MTRKQHQQRQQAQPRQNAQQQTIRQQYLLAELHKIGWHVTAAGPYALYLQRKAG